MSAVTIEYAHKSKAIRPAPSITLGDSVLKWYDLAPAEEPVPPWLQVLARGGLHAAGEAGLGLDDELGFVILHRCGESFYFLLITTWRSENELWETVCVKQGPDHPAFEPWPLDAGHHPTFCVWELRAVCHEQGAWSRFLRSSRDAVAKKEYLRDTYTGLA